MKVNPCPTATLLPYQMIQVNPRHILMFESGIKLESKSENLCEAYNIANSTPAFITFEPSLYLISLAIEQHWKIAKSRMVFATSQVILNEDQEYFDVQGTGKALVHGHQLIQLEDESFFLPEQNLAGHELRVNLKLGNISGWAYWQVSGPGKILIHSSHPPKPSKNLNDLQVSPPDTSSLLETILKNDDIILTSPFLSLLKTIKFQFQSPKSLFF
jgi:hypothetical protein